MTDEPRFRVGVCHGAVLSTSKPPGIGSFIVTDTHVLHATVREFRVDNASGVAYARRAADELAAKLNEEYP